MRHSPPKHLTPEGKRLWRRIYAAIEIADEPALLLLSTMCELFDKMNAARELLDKSGPVTQDRFGQLRAHPAVAIQRDAAAGLMRAWRLLGFDLATPGPIGRPPGR